MKLRDDMKIDFVVPWVDGSDPEWQKEYSLYSGKPILHERYRDWGVFKYWFRAVEKYAPWVNKVHLITCGQVPDWLNTKHSKLNLVFHKDYIPQQWLPTFSSHPIELNMHRINGLSEHFVYFNDDMYLSAPCNQEDFFRNGLPCDQAITAFYHSDGIDVLYRRICNNDIAVINKNFDKKQVIRNNPLGWFNLKYGKRLLHNLYTLPLFWFPGLHIHHVAQPFLKSTFNEVWDKERMLLEETSSHRFRDNDDVNQYLFRFWALCSGKFSPRRINIGGCYSSGGDKQLVQQWFEKQNKKIVCINDGEGDFDINVEMKFLQDLFATVFPEKSSFEK